MKLYGQHGAQPGDKLEKGLNERLIDGVVFGPRDISIDNLRTRIRDMAENYPHADRLFDPQYYTCLMAAGNNVRLGYLAKEDNYGAYYRTRRRTDLTHESTIRRDLTDALRFQAQLDLTHLIAPNVFISHSFDSREAAIAVDFLAMAGECFSELGETRPLFLTLAPSRDALLDRATMTEYVNEITAITTPACGYYLLVGAHSADARSEIFNSAVVAGWMYLTYALATNGFKVINGYADLLGPLLLAAGGMAAATGWWSNLRTFSLDRFDEGPGGGRLPVQRYLSTVLWNRITFYELNRLRTTFPEVLNRLPSDDLYPAEDGSQPERNAEILQSWEGLRRMLARVGNGPTEQRVERCREMISEAITEYGSIEGRLPLDQRSNGEHLEPMLDGIRLFKQLAELGVSAE